MNSWALALLPLIGVILGASLQFILTRAAEQNKRIAALRAEAYSDYLRAFAAAAHLQSDNDLVVAHRSAADAKARIVVYGEADVVKAIAKFELLGAVLNSEDSVSAFCNIVMAMREFALDVSPNDIRTVLTGPPTPPSNYHR